MNLNLPGLHRSDRAFLKHLFEIKIARLAYRSDKGRAGRHTNKQQKSNPLFSRLNILNVIPSHLSPSHAYIHKSGTNPQTSAPTCWLLSGDFCRYQSSFSISFSPRMKMAKAWESFRCFVWSLTCEYQWWWKWVRGGFLCHCHSESETEAYFPAHCRRWGLTRWARGSHS